MFKQLCDTLFLVITSYLSKRFVEYVGKKDNLLLTKMTS